MSVALAVQMKGLGFLLWPSMYSPMAMMSCSRSWKTPRRSRLWVRSRKKRSTMLSHDAEVGVKHTAQALDRRTHLRLAQLVTPSQQRLRTLPHLRRNHDPHRIRAPAPATITLVSGQVLRLSTNRTSTYATVRICGTGSSDRDPARGVFERLSQNRLPVE